ncbi:MAG: hypothetical protein AAGI01_02185, partial [Myxococcota bacterium]
MQRRMGLHILCTACALALMSCGPRISVRVPEHQAAQLFAPARGAVMAGARAGFVASKDLAIAPLDAPLEPVACSPSALELPRFAPRPKDKLQPAFDASMERTWIAPGKELEPSRGYGTWAVDASGGLAFDDGERGPGQWIMHRERAALTDGMVRARFTVDRHLRTTLLFRVSSTNYSDPSQTSGYGVRFDGRRATLVRLDEGEVTELSSSEDLERIHRRGAL